MSWAQSNRVTIDIEIPAHEAADLARRINWALSRAQDIQKQRPDANERTATDFDTLNQLMHTSICDGAIRIEVLPDKRTKGTSGYGDYSEPHHYAHST